MQQATGFAFFAESREPSSKGSKALGKELSAKQLSAKNSLPRARNAHGAVDERQCWRPGTKLENILEEAEQNCYINLTLLLSFTMKKYINLK